MHQVLGEGGDGEHRAVAAQARPGVLVGGDGGERDRQPLPRRGQVAGDDRRVLLAAGPRASMWLLTVLPLSGPLVAVLLGLPLAEVYGSAPAMVAAAVGLVLTCLGWSWSRALLRRALRPALVG